MPPLSLMFGDCPPNALTARTHTKHGVVLLCCRPVDCGLVAPGEAVIRCRAEVGDTGRTQVTFTRTVMGHGGL